MKLLKLIFPLLLVCGLMAPLTVSAQSQNEQAIKQRMLQRVHQVDALKTAGLVGENNKGFLEQRGPLNPSQVKVMTAENADRRALYNLIASRVGLTVTVVGEQRAESLRNNSAPGVWLQAPDGHWYKK